MRKMRSLRALTATAAVLAVLFVSQMPASAHYAAITHGKDRISTSSNHHEGELCDNEKDGHWVYGEWFFDDGSSYYAYNTNGADGACVELDFAGTIYKQMICEEDKPNCFWSYV